MGNPVAHSRSPAIHARFAELTGQQLRYERRLIALDGFAQGVRDFIRRRQARLQHHRALQVRGPGPGQRVQRTRVPGRCCQRAGALRQTAASTPTTPTAWAWWPTSPATRACPLQGADIAAGGRRRCRRRRAGPAAAGWRAPHHHCQPHRGRAGRWWPRTAPWRRATKTELLALAPQALEGDFDVIINATASSLAGDACPCPPACCARQPGLT